MQRVLEIISAICLLIAVSSLKAEATTGRVVKVLPHLIDLKGRHALSPSLYERDAYQAYLRKRPEEVSGVRFDVKWRAKAEKKTKLKLRVELRSDARGRMPGETTIEKEISTGAFSRWTSLALTGDDYRRFGEVTAWRVTVWEGDRLLGEQRSFLW